MTVLTAFTQGAITSTPSAWLMTQTPLQSLGYAAPYPMEQLACCPVHIKLGLIYLPPPHKQTSHSAFGSSAPYFALGSICSFRTGVYSYIFWSVY